MVDRNYVSTALPTVLATDLGASGNPSVISLPGTWPAAYPFPVLIDWGDSAEEAILVTSAPTGTGPYSLPCTRGIDGTTAQAHNAGAQVAHGTTGYEPTLIQENAAAIAALEAGVGGGSVSLGGDLGNTNSDPQVLSTHLTTPLPVNQGGTDSMTQNWQGLLTPTTQTGTYTATPGQLVKANIASASWTLTLPTAPAANTIVGAKVMANATGNTHALTVACGSGDFFEQSGGGTSVTMSLPLQAAAWQYNGGYWTRVSDDLPLAQLSGLYANVFSPMAYGAKGNGTTDDTAAVQAAFAAAAAVQGVVDLGTKIYKTSSPVTLSAFITIRGASTNTQNGTSGGIITNSASDVFTLASAVVGVLIENCGIIASAGHVFNAGTSSVSSFNVDGVWISQAATNKAIWYQTGGAYIGNAWGARKVSILTCSASATVSPWYCSAPTINNNYFGMMRAQGQGAGVPFFYLAKSTAGWTEENTFDQIIFEVCNGGAIAMVSASDVQINQCSNWDLTAATGSGYSFTGNSGYPCASITITNGLGAEIGTLYPASGYYDLYCATGTLNVVLVNWGGGIGAAPLISVPAGQLTVIGGQDNSGYPLATLPRLAVSGGRPWFDVIAFGADPTGTADSTAAISAAILAAASGNLTPSSTTRFAAGPVYLPAGTYKVSSDLLIQSFAGFQLTGAGADCTVIEAHGTGFTTAVINIDGSLDGTFAGFQVSGDTTEGVFTRTDTGCGTTNGSAVVADTAIGTGDVGSMVTGTGIPAYTHIVSVVGGTHFTMSANATASGTVTVTLAEPVPSAINLTWTTGAARSTSANTFRNIRVRNLAFTAGITQAAPAGTTHQVDGSYLHDVVIAGGQAAGSWTSAGPWQQGYVFGNGTEGNQYDYTLSSAGVSGCYYGWYCSASGYQLYGAQPAQNYCDFYFSSPGAQVSVTGIQSQNSQMLVSGGGGSAAVLVSFRAVMFKGWASSAPPSNEWISLGAGATAWTFADILCYVGAGYTPVVGVSGSGGAAVVTLINFQQAASLSAGFSASSTATIAAINYVQLTTSNTVSTVFPLYIWNGTAWVNIGSGGGAGALLAANNLSDVASAPTAVTNLGLNVSADWVTATGSYTWTKPANAQAVDVVLLTGGAGGGSGAFNASGSGNAGGGGGGMGGSIVQRSFMAADLPSSVTGSVGTGGTGGAAVSGTTGTSSGNAGTSGAATTFGAYCAAESPGLLGGAGTTAAGGAGGTYTQVAGLTGSAGGGGGASGNGTGGNPAMAASGGGGGGGATTTTAGNGGSTAFSSLGSTTNLASGGVSGGASPGTGTQPSVKGTPSCGAGGGAGAFGASATAQAGANAYYGGGGGGGGGANGGTSSSGTITSGAGGNGGPGWVLVITHFA